MVFVLGIDIGSAFSKGIIMCDKEIAGSYVMPSAGNYKLTADRVKEELLSKVGISSKDILFFSHR